MNNDESSIIDLVDYFDTVLEGYGEMIDEFIFAVTDQHGADALEWQYEDGMQGMPAGVNGVIFFNPLDAVFFKADITSYVEPCEYKS